MSPPSKPPLAGFAADDLTEAAFNPGVTESSPHGDSRRPTGALWADRMAIRLWMACCLALWVLGLVNLVSGLHTR